MVDAVSPGTTTGELDAVGREVFLRYGARSAPRVTYRFPGSTCISVNDEAAHGVVSPVASRLLEATKLAQRDARDAAQLGARLRDLGRAVQRRARRHGFCVIKNLNGHGIGRGLHDLPSVPSIDDGQRMVLREGLVLAIEPFLSISADHVVDGEDGWTLRTADGSLVVQFEHSIVVTREGPLVLTA
jgi:methionyl aminopeptidase